MMIPGPMDHLKANAIAVALGAVLVLVVQAASQASKNADSGQPPFWERWTGGWATF